MTIFVQLLDGMRDELLLFATAGLALGGLDDLCVDGLWLGRWLRCRRSGNRGAPTRSVSGLLPPKHAGRIAIFVPAWDEAEVIGDMIRHALASWDGQTFDLFVGVYPNDPATGAAVRAIGDSRVIAALAHQSGPTTKADCLNALYGMMASQEAKQGFAYKAVLLHDAEDLVHPDELYLCDRLIEDHALLQIPVLPLETKGSRWVSGHYLDEFAQAHCRDMVVRGALGASLPAAGVGCAVRRDALSRLAGEHAGRPFGADSLTEDYELGLKLSDLGYATAFVRMTDREGTALVATRAHFPDTLGAAVRQKARWTIGIALAGWDRMGWQQSWIENWMRLRDRRAPFAALIVAAGYAAFGLSVMIATLGGGPPHPEAYGRALLIFTSLCLVWRTCVRSLCVWRDYGLRAALIAIPRTLTSNVIFVLAARRAVLGYLRMIRTGRVQWDKTRHRSPLVP